MQLGDKIVVINGIYHGLRGEIMDTQLDGKLLCKLVIDDWFYDGVSFVSLDAHDIELEERRDLWQHLI